MRCLLLSVAGMTTAICMSITSMAYAQQPLQVNVNVAPTPTAPDDKSALAEKLQNPIADLISVPFQNNTNFNVGPNHGAQDILNIQPVIPIHVNPDWNIITRTIGIAANGDVWIADATKNQLLYFPGGRWVGNAQSFTVVRFPADDPSKVESFRAGIGVRGVALDSKGNLWVASNMSLGFPPPVIPDGVSVMR